MNKNDLILIKYKIDPIERVFWTKYFKKMNKFCNFNNIFFFFNTNNRQIYKKGYVLLEIYIEWYMYTFILYIYVFDISKDKIKINKKDTKKTNKNK